MQSLIESGLRACAAKPPAPLVRDPRARGDLVLVHRALGRVARTGDQVVAPMA